MPFDGTIEPNLQMLSAALRDWRQWPAGFQWDYQSQKSCAVGLATQLYGKRAFQRMTPWLHIPFSPMFDIFFFGAGTDKPRSAVTPDDVANGIDAYLAWKKQ